MTAPSTPGRSRSSLRLSWRSVTVLAAVVAVFGAVVAAPHLTGRSTRAVHDVALDVPSRLDLSSRHAVPGPAAPAAATGCNWYTLSGKYWTGGTVSNPNSVRLSVELLGLYNSAGYCGLVSDHVCAQPLNSGFSYGLLIYNWWYSNGNYVTTKFDRFNPNAGQTVCSYSPSYSASYSADADGKFVDGTKHVIGMGATASRV